jgi:drug/metabolite transporter (DMT)-like permease
MLMVLAAATLWSTSGLFIKVLAVPAVPVAGLRSLVAGLTLLPFVRPRGLRVDWFLPGLVLAYLVTNLGFVVATRWTTASNAIALQSTAPAWVFLFTCIAARRVPIPLLFPIGVVLTGIGVILAEPALGTSRAGNLMGLGTGLGFGLAQLFFARTRQSPAAMVCLANLGTALSCWLIQPGAFRLGEIALRDWVILAYLGAGQVALGFMLFAGALRLISVTQASILSLLEPLLNPVWVYLVVGEHPSAYGFAGGGLILLGIVLDVSLRPRVARRPTLPGEGAAGV